MSAGWSNCYLFSLLYTILADCRAQTVTPQAVVAGEIVVSVLLLLLEKIKFVEWVKLQAHEINQNSNSNKKKNNWLILFHAFPLGHVQRTTFVNNKIVQLTKTETTTREVVSSSKLGGFNNQLHISGTTSSWALSASNHFWFVCLLWKAIQLTIKKFWKQLYEWQPLVSGQFYCAKVRLAIWYGSNSK